MPDYSISSRDPYLRAKAVADAQLGPTPTWLLTGSVCLVSTLIAFVLVGSVATDVTTRVVISVAYLPVGLVTLAAVHRARSLLRKRSRLIDELWKTYTAEASQLRTGSTGFDQPATSDPS